MSELFDVSEFNPDRVIVPATREKPRVIHNCGAAELAFGDCGNKEPVGRLQPGAKVKRSARTWLTSSETCKVLVEEAAPSPSPA